MNPKYTNALARESSPYLLQHAHNPVDWVAWSPQALQQAKKENKLLLISIGYAACHWCHVMEHECFEDIEVAEVMNAHFINIKVDREERPDVDQIYMDALQMMTGNGGWPLNIVALPDGRPFWGATYVNKKNWIQALLQLSDLFRTQPQKVLAYAENMTHGLTEINKIEKSSVNNTLALIEIDAIVEEWKGYFDPFMGGYKRAPKFMMPVNLEFLLYYGHSQRKEDILDYVHTTLTRMAWGGIFDHVGGGFSRYAVDTKWHIPHFEKMLYDNGQLISIYAKAYALTKNRLYKSVVEKTVRFLEEHLLDSHFGFYASLDADSLNTKGQLKEGAYYVWTKNELKTILKDTYEVFAKYYNINDYGHWEDDHYVLILDNNQPEILQEFGLTKPELHKVMENCLSLLKKERDRRQKPRLDDKILTSWNGYALKGLTDAYRYLKDSSYLQLALKNAHFISDRLIEDDGKLWHSHKQGKSTINGFLEDYAAVIDAFIGLYETALEEQWLVKAKALTDYAITNFYNQEEQLFYFTSKEDDVVIRRTYEVADNVIPASNSMMAQNLFKLSKYYARRDYQEMAARMVEQMDNNIRKNPQSHANWLHLCLSLQLPFHEIAVVGPDYVSMANTLASYYLPNTILAGNHQDSSIPLLKGKTSQEKTLIYVCKEGQCKLPVDTLKEVMAQLEPKHRE
jgi:uncharacterized protein YyaL (SSP411 family)